MQFLRVFSILAIASATYASASVNIAADGLVTEIPEAAVKYAQSLLAEGSAGTGSLDGRGERPRKRGDVVKGDCSQGSVQCCDQTINDSQKKKTLAGLLGVNDVVGQIGLNCAQLPINGIGGSVAVSNTCKSSPVCCKNVTQNGLINFGCISLPLN
ncbi:hypothetical protein FA10DRAFT_264352 [Acaromyces ingoldii]|uniref:Hydrophobin n=1 Tax=Acaromyces ingoldii TaxID=215250 RepID=A0A316Z0U7_9BASI|nr:hypothetical protein FA10DRAFT_264352 [Acaromyces ingoldii]PWN93745.1 hypothetical protein FA10DRAFT_264352 [Acaromyces ingoldii]